MSFDGLKNQLLTSTEQRMKRHKIIKTVWIFWAIMLVGFTNAILGPTIMSLLSITSSPIKSIEIVFIAQGIGFICGIVGGAMVSRVTDLHTMLTVSIFLACFTNMALPWMGSLPALLVFIFLQFCLKGVVDYGAMFLCGTVWPQNNHVPFQFISIGVGLASFVAPFFAYPVLQHPDETSRDKCFQAHTVRLLAHNSSGYDMPPSKCHGIASPVNMIYIPFLVIAAIMLPPGVAFAYYTRHNNSVREESSYASYESFSDNNDGEQQYPDISNNLYWFILTLLMLFFVPFGGVFVTYSHLLTAFGVQSDLKMAPSSMALMTSLYWGSFLLGRILNAFFSSYIPQFVVIVCNFAGLFIADFVLVSFAGHSAAALWGGTALMSLFNSAFLPGVLTWVGSYISLKGNAICLSLIGLATGELVVPFLAAYAFTNFGPMSLMWIIGGLCCFELALFITLAIIFTTKFNNQKPAYQDLTTQD